MWSTRSSVHACAFDQYRIYMTKDCIILLLLNGPFLFAGWLTARYILAVLGSISLAILYGLKVNLSVTIVVMVNHTRQYPDSSANVSSSCPKSDKESTKEQVR
jgi:hypothetical protein